MLGEMDKAKDARVVADLTRPPAGESGLHGVPIAAAAALLWLLVVGAGLAHAELPAAPATDQVAASVWAAQQSDLCAVALRQAEQRYHLPPALLVSIARAESGRPITSLADVRPWPWTIDADGSGLFLDSKAAAIAWLRQQELRHRFVDVGCMQIDLHYHPDAFISLEEALDPAANADYAARLLVDLYRGEAGGSWDIAVGLYHSHTSLLAAEYRDRVALIGADVLHGTLKGVPLYVRAVRQGTLRLPLGGGKVALINVHRQPAKRSRHPFTTCQIEHILAPYLNGARRSAVCVEATR
jgi:Transglycosylase SLT domain